MEPITHDDGPPTGRMQASQAQPPPVNITIAVHNSNRQDGLVALLVGVVLGFAAALLMADEKNLPRR